MIMGGIVTGEGKWKVLCALLADDTKTLREPLDQGGTTFRNSRPLEEKKSFATHVNLLVDAEMREHARDRSERLR